MSSAIVQPRRVAGLRRLVSFSEDAGRLYASWRNYDFGPARRDNVSMLSAYLSHRLVLEEEVLRAVLRRHAFSNAQKFIEEVFWRTYYKGWLEQRPSVWRDYRTSVSQCLKQLDTDPALHARYTAAIEGRTNIDCFDAWVGELRHTGYLHNHARMWFASIWIFTLRLPWSLGADFFYRHLIDGDAASNTLGWRWVAGLHTRGKTYLARAANICRYTNGRFNPDGMLAPMTTTIADTQDHAIEALAPGDNIPRSSKWGLLITEEDGCPTSLIGSERPAAVLGLASPRSRSPLPIGTVAHRFALGCVRDAAMRTARFYGTEANSMECDDWTTQLVSWAEKNDLEAIVTPYQPMGPIAELLASADAALGCKGVRLHQIRRPYDSLAWPHARRGYFQFRRAIPQIVEQLGIDCVEQAIADIA
ncbi:MAG: FAD-binding domain-containing protein [Pseudomonadota bacterium]